MLAEALANGLEIGLAALEDLYSIFTPTCPLQRQPPNLHTNINSPRFFLSSTCWLQRLTSRGMDVNFAINRALINRQLPLRRTSSTTSLLSSLFTHFLIDGPYHRLAPRQLKRCYASQASTKVSNKSIRKIIRIISFHFLSPLSAEKAINPGTSHFKRTLAQELCVWEV